MKILYLLIILYLVDYVYLSIFSNLVIVTLHQIIANQTVGHHSISLKIDLNQHLTINNPNYYLINHLIHLSLPVDKFLAEHDLVSFEYQLIYLDISNQKTMEKPCVILIKFVELLVDENVSVI